MNIYQGLECANCGAVADDLICGFCGAVVSPDNSIEGQRAALGALHRLIEARNQNAEDQAGVMRLLQTGYLPLDRDLLFEAASRALGMSALPVGLIYEGVQARVQAIIFRLRLMPDDSLASAAADQLVQRLQDIEQRELERKRNETLLEKMLTRGMMLVGLLFVLLPVILLIRFLFW